MAKSLISSDPANTPAPKQAPKPPNPILQAILLILHPQKDHENKNAFKSLNRSKLHRTFSTKTILLRRRP